MIIKKRSIFTGKENEMDLDITEDQLNRFLTTRDCIQDVFPNLNADEREFLRIGVTPEECAEFQPTDDLD